MDAVQSYALGIAECADLISAVGHRRTVLVQGHMGSGKSAIRHMLAERFPGHVVCYFDCTTKDVGDIVFPKIGEIDARGYVTYVPNEEFGVHLERPVILMLDELGKAPPPVKNALLRVMQERYIGNQPLHPESIVFATTNLGAEGVGDLLMPHARNRIIVVTMRKANNMEWIGWGIDHGIDPIILGWARDNPQLFHGFEDHDDPAENPYIYHPRAQRDAFVTPRSLEAASDIVKARDRMSAAALTAALNGAIGARGGMDLAAYVALGDEMPKLEDIKHDPEQAVVPKSPAAVCMVVYRSLATVDKDWFSAWMTYMARLDPEAQAIFVNGVRSVDYNAARKSWILSSPLIQDWAIRNGYMFQVVS